MIHKSLVSNGTKLEEFRVQIPSKKVDLVSRVSVDNLRSSVEAEARTTGSSNKLKNASRLISLANKMAPGQNQSKLSVVDLTKSMLNVGNMLKDLAQESSAPGISIIPSQQHTT